MTSGKILSIWSSSVVHVHFLLPMSYELVEKISPNPNEESSEPGIVVAKMVAGPSPRVLAAANVRVFLTER